MASEHHRNQSPNFHRAQQDEPYLKQRYKHACEEAESLARLDSLKTFTDFIEQHKTVCINMKTEALLNLLSNERIGYINLHNNLDAGAVTDYDAATYEKRKRVDEFLFGANYKEFVHGALNVGNGGLVSYGEYCVVLKNSAHLREKSSFLEENSFHYFVESPPYMALPNGATALWKTVSQLGTVKHLADVCDSENCEPSEIADIVLHSEESKRTDRYIEAHVLKPIGLKHIERVVYSSPPEIDVDLVPHLDIAHRYVAQRLEARGIPLETRRGRQS